MPSPTRLRFALLQLLCAIATVSTVYLANVDIGYGYGSYSQGSYSKYSQGSYGGGGGCGGGYSQGSYGGGNNGGAQGSYDRGITPPAEKSTWDKVKDAFEAAKNYTVDKAKDLVESAKKAAGVQNESYFGDLPSASPQKPPAEPPRDDRMPTTPPPKNANVPDQIQAQIDRQKALDAVDKGAKKDVPSDNVNLEEKKKQFEKELGIRRDGAGITLGDIKTLRDIMKEQASREARKNGWSQDSLGSTESGKAWAKTARSLGANPSLHGPSTGFTESEVNSTWKENLPDSKTSIDKGMQTSPKQTVPQLNVWR